MRGVSSLLWGVQRVRVSGVSDIGSGDPQQRPQTNHLGDSEHDDGEGETCGGQQGEKERSDMVAGGRRPWGRTEANDDTCRSSAKQQG